MGNTIVAGNNDTIVIDDKDTVNKTVNKTVNVTKVDNTQVENDIKIIRSDVSKLLASMTKHASSISRIEKKVDKLTAKLESPPVAKCPKGGKHE